jgi:hypothetical protein
VHHPELWRAEEGVAERVGGVPILRALIGWIQRVDSVLRKFDTEDEALVGAFIRFGVLGDLLLEFPGVV